MIGRVYRHKKRGTQYVVIGLAKLQMDGPHDMAEMVIYCGYGSRDPQEWVRLKSEFLDGRFEEVQP